MTRWADADGLERRPQRRAHHPELRRTRQAMVEQPLGTLTRWMAQGDFLMRGKQNVRTDMRGSMLADNLTRGLHILGVNTRIEALA